MAIIAWLCCLVLCWCNVVLTIAHSLVSSLPEWLITLLGLAWLVVEVLAGLLPALGSAVTTAGWTADAQSPGFDGRNAANAGWNLAPTFTDLMELLEHVWGPLAAGTSAARGLMQISVLLGVVCRTIAPSAASSRKRRWTELLFCPMTRPRADWLVRMTPPALTSMPTTPSGARPVAMGGRLRKLREFPANDVRSGRSMSVLGGVSRRCLEIHDWLTAAFQGSNAQVVAKSVGLRMVPLGSWLQPPFPGAVVSDCSGAIRISC
jgi:hypothetical protein